MLDINDQRRIRATAAAAMTAASVVIDELETATDTPAETLAAAVAEFEAAQTTFNEAQATVSRLEAVEAANGLAASGGDGEQAPVVPATVATAGQDGVELGFIVHALTNARGSVNDACTALDSAGHSGISAALSGATQSAGGVLLPRPQSETIIELLRPRVTVRASGARVMPMPAGSLRSGRMSAGASAAYGEENGTAGASEPTFDGVDKSFKTLTALVPIGNALLMHSNAAVAMEVRNDLLSVMGTREDLGFLRDVGADGTPYGLKFWTPPENWLEAVSAAWNAVEVALRSLLSKVEDSDVMMVSPGWIMRAATKNFLATLRNGDTGFLVYPSIDQSGTLHGYPIKTTSQIPNNLGVGGDETEVYFADFNEVMIGDAQQVTIATSSEASFVNAAGDMVSAFANNLTLMRAISEHDLAPRHAQGLAGLNGVGWAL